MNLRLLKLFASLFLCFEATNLALLAQGEVYLVIGSDTAVWNVSGGVDVTKYRGHFLPDVYIDPNGNGYQVMDPAFRNRFTDSYGQRLKLTWWMMVGGVYLQCDSTDVPIPNLMPLYLMQKYHGDAMTQFGDEVSLHYHTFFWSDYDGDGKYYWNQSRTFHESRQDFDFALAQALLEGEVFPVSFRSGWHYMDNEWQQYLNLLLPYSLHNASPIVRADNVEPYDNVYDWSKATTAFVPFHPSTTNYQMAGDGIGWNVRSVKMPSVTQTTFNQMFAAAANGTNQVACFWAHLPETDYLTNVARMDTFAHVAAGNYPAVKFRYCTAVEAMQRWRGTVDTTPPELQVAEDIQGETVTLNITTSEPIFQPEPFVAVKDICEQYRLVSCVPAGANRWTVTVPLPRTSLAKIGIAVTDLAGNLTTRVIRYLPDDLYIDNLDPQYLEVPGNWTQSTNAAWGTDARVALLGENDSATVRWSLPITRSGGYKIAVQVPVVTNSAGNCLFTISSAGSHTPLALVSAPLPGKQWVVLGTAVLDQTISNSLEMTVSGAGQAGTFAVADVIKLSPLVPQPQFFKDVQVDATDTTANIRWTTLAPAMTYVEYGQDLRYGRFSVTNTTLVKNHVMTLAGLTTNTLYLLQIDAADGTGHCPAQFSFTTTSFTATTRLFDLTNTWKFSTNQLDQVDWRAPTYDDSSWPGGPGLLWADSRGSNFNPAIQPKGTFMPTNSATKSSFVTYYFRTHFSLPGNAQPMSLTFSNYIDDGAVFYLNGAEVYRQNMAAPPTVISNSTLATAFNCGGDATCAVVFAVSGNLLTNLVSGDNVLAVEVHNYTARGSDITFGSALSSSHLYTPNPAIQILRSGNLVTIYWNGGGFTLQEANELKPTTDWIDVPGPVTSSPYFFDGAPGISRIRFYRLRQ